MSSAPIDPARVLVTGAGGMVGRAIKFGIKLTRDQLDVCDEQSVARAFAAHRPAAVLHLAALDMRQCETAPLLALRTNVLGTWHLAQAARRQGIPLTLVSSGAVFNGATGTLHDEAAPLDPQNLYGQTKQLAEILLNQSPDALIVRTGWLFGADQAHHQRFVERAIPFARAGDPIFGTIDQQGSPTWVVDLADELLRLIQSGARGIVHVANAGVASGVDLGREIVAILESRSEVRPVRATELPNSGPRRAASEALSTQGIPLRPWQAALRAYIESRGGR